MNIPSCIPWWLSQAMERSGFHRNMAKCRSGETSGCHPLQPLAHRRARYSRLLRATSTKVLDIFRNGDTTTFWGNLFQHLTTLSEAMFVSSQNFLYYNIWPLPSSLYHAPLSNPTLGLPLCNPTLGRWQQESDLPVARVLHWHSSQLIAIQLCPTLPAACT